MYVRLTDEAEMVHSGFQVAYFLVREELMSYLRGLDAEYVSVESVYFIGHSLGGALAHFAFLDCQVMLTTFSIILPDSYELDCVKL